MMKISYDAIAQAAISQYGIVPDRCHFLGHSESVTFCVETSSEKFLLRIHQPTAQNQDNRWQQPEVIESELLWLSALHDETSISLQKPVKNLDHRWVTQVWVDESAGRFYCSLLHWLEGEVMSVQPTAQQAYRLGTVLARLHQHSHQWQLPQNFVRPAYDRSRLQWALSELHRAVLSGLISP
jgi:Ser/Thr protein kinase RdoA (MazF antagonist)